jgi:hypothetical protein
MLALAYCFSSVVHHLQMVMTVVVVVLVQAVVEHIQQMNQLMLLQNDPAFITGYPNTIPATNMPFNLEQSIYGSAVPSSYDKL